MSLDPELERKILDNVLEEQHRAIVTTPGVDLVTVLRYALAAHHRRVVRDAVLLADLCALIIIAIFLLRSPAAFLVFVMLMLVAAWAVVLREGYVTMRVIRNSPARAFVDLPLVVSKVLISARRA